MPSPKYIINIPQPCHENWQQMTPDGNGRFCAHCSKTVIDFSCMTDAQVVALLQKKEGKLCGRLNTEQLNRVITLQQPVGGYWGKIKSAIAASVLLFTVRGAAAKAVHVKAPITANPFTDKNKKHVAKDSTVKMLKGRIIDFKDESVPCATITNITAQQRLARMAKVIADTGGYFTIMAQINDSIQITMVGYQKLEITITNEQFSALNSYKLQDEILGEMAVVVVTKSSRPEDDYPSFIDLIKERIKKRKLQKAAGN